MHYYILVYKILMHYYSVQIDILASKQSKISKFSLSQELSQLRNQNLTFFTISLFLYVGLNQDAFYYFSKL